MSNAQIETDGIFLEKPQKRQLILYLIILHSADLRNEGFHVIITKKITANNYD